VNFVIYFGTAILSPPLILLLIKLVRKRTN